MRIRLALLCLVAGALALGAAPAAFADADPPSDILILQDVYFPYQPKVSPAPARELKQAQAALKRKGLNLKIAIVASQVDLGAVPQLFNQSEKYAKFLGSEIAFNSKKPLLIAMPSGLATSNLPPKAAATAAAVKIGSDQDSDALTKAATEGIVKIAAAVGKPIPEPKSSGGSSTKKKSGGGNTVLIVVGVILSGVLLLALIVIVRRLSATNDADEILPDDAEEDDRRAEKAAYLEEKLEEQEAADREASD